MASIEVMNVKQANPEAPIEIQLSTSNITYRGPKGDQGPAGPAGRDGAVGYDGKSAYELAVDNGFEGTEVEWLASLKGETGATGPAGAQGPKGDQGIQGPQGETGATGPAGAQGPAGQNGTTPVKGTDYFTQQDIADIVAQVSATDIKFLVSSGSGSSTGTSSTLLSGLSAADKTYLLDAYNDQLKNTRYFVIQDTSGALFYPLTTYSMRLVFLGGVNFQNYYYLKFDDTPGSATTIQKWDKEDVVPNWGAIKAGSTVADPFNSSANTSVADAFSYINTNFATKSYVENIVRAAQTGMLKRQVVQALPQSNIDDYTIYMVPKTGEPGDVYYEYLYVNDNWEYLGSTEVDLTDYATIDYVDQRIASPKTKYTIVSHTAYAGSDTQRFDDFPQALKDILWAWASNLSSSQWEISADFASYSQGAEQFEVYLDRGLGTIDKIDHIIAQKKDNNTKYLYFCQRGINSLGDNSYERNQVNYGLKTLLQLTMPNNNASWATHGMSGTQYYVLTGIRAKDVITSSRQKIGGVYYNTVEDIIRRKQNQLTAGSNISIVNDTISAVAATPEYLTNSDVLAIWNGNNE